MDVASRAGDPRKSQFQPWASTDAVHADVSREICKFRLLRRSPSDNFWDDRLFTLSSRSRWRRCRVCRREERYERRTLEICPIFASRGLFSDSVHSKCLAIIFCETEFEQRAGFRRNRVGRRLLLFKYLYQSRSDPIGFPFPFLGRSDGAFRRQERITKRAAEAETENAITGKIFLRPFLGIELLLSHPIGDSGLALESSPPLVSFSLRLEHPALALYQLSCLIFRMPSNASVPPSPPCMC